MRIPSHREVAFAVGKVTFMEVLSERVLYNVIICGIFLFGAGLLASRLTFLRPDRVVLDFGLSALNLSCSALAILIGAGLLGKEYERRTVHVALSHPISRPQFVTGKFLGISGVLTLNWLLLVFVYCLLLSCMSGFGLIKSNPAFFPAIFLILLQSFVIASISIFFSTFSTTALAVMMSIGVYLAGQDISELRVIISQIESPGLRHMLRALSMVPPDFEYFNLGLRLTYGLPIEAMTLLHSVGYGIVLLLMFLFAAGFAVRFKEV